MECRHPADGWAQLHLHGQGSDSAPARAVSAAFGTGQVKMTANPGEKEPPSRCVGRMRTARDVRKALDNCGGARASFEMAEQDGEQ